MLLIVAVSMVSKKGSVLANRIFAVFILAKTLCFTTDFFYYNFSFATEHATPFFFAGYSFDLLLGPLMMFYFKALSSQTFKLEKKHLYHTAPFILHMGYMYIVFFSKSNVQKAGLITSGQIYTWHFSLVNLLIYLSFIIYAALLIKELKKYHKHIKAQTAAFDKYQLNWMLVITSGLIVIWAMAIASGSLSMAGIKLTIPIYLYIIPIFIFVNLMFFMGLNYPTAEWGAGPANTTVKYRNSTLDNKQKEELLKQLLDYTENQKPYLDPDINITNISRAMDIPPHQLSQIINCRLNKNFFTFISEYRIEESKRMLSNTANKQTVLEILYAVGFNSKSAFNKAFKKQTGLTPTQYRKEAVMAQKIAG